MPPTVPSWKLLHLDVNIMKFKLKFWSIISSVKQKPKNWHCRSNTLGRECACFFFLNIPVIMTSGKVSLERLSMRFYNMSVGICPLGHMIISRVRCWCGVRRPSVRLAFQFIPKVSQVSVSSSTPALANQKSLRCSIFLHWGSLILGTLSFSKGNSSCYRTPTSYCRL